jgi:hypothetical protein
MIANNLVGKMAIRIHHVTYAGGGTDRSFLDSPVKILKVTDSHIVCEYSTYSSEPSKIILPYEYLDDNWTNYDKLIKMPEPKISFRERVYYWVENIKTASVSFTNKLKNNRH